MNVKYGAAVTVVASLIAIGAAFVSVDERYAHAAEFKKLEMRLDQKILEDQSDRLQDRIWKLQDRAKLAPVDNDELRKLQDDKEKVDTRLKSISDQTTVIK